MGQKKSRKAPWTRQRDQEARVILDAVGMVMAALCALVTVAWLAVLL
jgi:hypothetical protein